MAVTSYRLQPDDNLIFFVFPAQWRFTPRPMTGAAPVSVSGPVGGFPALTDTGAIRGPLAMSADGRYVAYIALSPTTGHRAGRIDTNLPVSEDLLNDGFFNGNSIDISDDGAYLAIGGQQTVDDRTRNVVEGWVPPCVPAGEFSFNCNTEFIALGTTPDTVSELNYNPSVSADGRYVAFTSNIPEGAAALTSRQVYVRDRAVGESWSPHTWHTDVGGSRRAEIVRMVRRSLVQAAAS
jgi:hypothetical protein